MRMDRPKGVHNEERTFLDRITQLKSILRNRCGDGRWSCHLDGAALAGRSGTGVRAAPGQCTQRRRRQIARPIAIAVHNAINIHSTGIFLPGNSGRSARAMPIAAMLTVVAAITLFRRVPATLSPKLDFSSIKRFSETKRWSSPPEKKPQKRGFLTRSDRLPLLGSHLGPRWLWARRESIVP
jgi:hypothetical protein